MRDDCDDRDDECDHEHQGDGDHDCDDRDDDCDCDDRDGDCDNDDHDGDHDCDDDDDEDCYSYCSDDRDCDGRCDHGVPDFACVCGCSDPDSGAPICCDRGDIDDGDDDHEEDDWIEEQ